MKKTLFKALIPTMAMILVAIMALTGTTYAWFTETKTATVGDIDITVTDKSSMKVAVMASAATQITSWSNSISTTALKGSKNAKMPDWTDMDATSSVYGKAGTFYTAAIDDTDSTKITAAAADNGTTTNYIMFQFYIWNDSTSANTVSLNGTAITGSSGVQSALRVSLVNMGKVSTGTYGGAAFTPAAGSEGNAAIWEPAGVSSTKAVNSAFTGSQSASQGTHLTEQQTVATASSLGVTIDANSVQMVAVYIWLEGQDVDCTNSITGQGCKIALKIDGEN